MRVACPTGTSGPYWPEGDLGAPSPAARLRVPHGGGAGPRPHDPVATGDPEDGDAEECMGGGREGDKFLVALRCYDMRAQPVLDDRLAKRARFQMGIDELYDRLRPSLQPRTVQPEKNVHAGEGDALVAVDETMVHRKAFPQRRSLLDQIGIIAGPGS